MADAGSSDSNDDFTPKRKKRLYSTDTSNERIERKARKNLGEQYTTAGGTTVPAKSFMYIKSCCNQHCHLNLPRGQQDTIFSTFYGGQGKNLQDSYLSSCMRVDNRNRRVKCNSSRIRPFTWKYAIKPQEVTVCQAFMLKLFQIGRKRLRVIQSKLLNGSDYEEKRGSHSNRPHKLLADVTKLMKEHLETIPSEYSHYCGKKTSKKYFQDSSLTCKKLHKYFQGYYFEKTKTPLKMSYTRYHKIFINLNYGFSRPKTDVCDYCTACEQKLKIDANDPCILEYTLHKKRVVKRTQMRKEYIEKAKNQKDLLVLEFDYAQNYPVPKLNVSSQFYKRLLWLYCFNVHVFNNDKSFMYCFMETTGKKDTNSVISFLYDAIHKVMTPEIKTIVFLSDACGGQNKNYQMLKFGVWLSKHLNVTIEHLFPVRGHSFSQCDRNFGIVRKMEKKIETTGTAKPYLECMVLARKNPEPFTVLCDHTLLRDWKSKLEPMFFAKPISKSKTEFLISKYVFLKFRPDGTVLASKAFTIMTHEVFSIWKMKKELAVPLQQCPPAGISNEKKKDVLALMQYLDHDSQNWILALID